MMRAPWLLAVLLVLTCCACEDLQHAVEPVWNKQVCAHCHMVLSDPSFAAQLVTADGRRLYFDDVGCLATYLHESRRAVSHSWVRARAGWVEAATARFSSGASSPMGFGFVTDARGPLDFAAVAHDIGARVERGDRP
jgi:copper chaperone NosL